MPALPEGRSAPPSPRGVYKQIHGFAAAALSIACASGSSQPPGSPDGGAPDAAPIDASVDAAPPPVDAAPPDAALPPTAIVSLSPSLVAVSRGGTARLTVTLDRPALSPGASVALESDDPAGTTFTIPAQVTVPTGQTSASFTVTSVAVGGPFDVRATFGVSVQASSVRVVPALLSIAPQGASDIVVGSSETYVVTLEAATAAPVDVSIATPTPGIVTAPLTVTIPMGGASAAFAVTGSALGGPVDLEASIGDVTVATTARVVGLYLSEILYDVTGTDTMKEWVELYNASSVPIDVAGVRIQVANTTGAYVDALVLSGTIPPAGCATVGGPLVGAAASNFTPDGFIYFVAGDFSPDLGNAGSAMGDPGDGLSLTTAAGHMVDNVIYGRNNNDMITDENGVAPVVVDVDDAPAAQSIERTAPGLAGPWVIQAAPNPGDCAAISM